ncbi:hypothetical protein BHE74_00054178 [Ensete ventricosum]|nr:hypothetical protein BHE74_00054178 [Ensete ventricosum]RZS28652.1 hypothetical protein BHM03_00062281 [Ensete ventricosum]
MTIAISFARLQEERLNQDAWRTKVTTRSVAHIPSTPSTISRPSQLKELTREEHRDRFAKGLCWHYNQPWSHGHRCKKGMLLMIEPIEESKEEDPEPEEDTKKDMQLVVSTVHALAGYTNPQAMKIEGFLEQQPVIVLIDTKSTNNFMNNKVAARLMFQKEDYSEFNVKVADDRILKCNQK